MLALDVGRGQWTRYDERNGRSLVSLAQLGFVAVPGAGFVGGTSASMVQLTEKGLWHNVFLYFTTRLVCRVAACRLLLCFAAWLALCFALCWLCARVTLNKPYGLCIMTDART